MKTLDNVPLRIEKDGEFRVLSYEKSNRYLLFYHPPEWPQYTFHVGRHRARKTLEAIGYTILEEGAVE